VLIPFFSEISQQNKNELLIGILISEHTDLPCDIRMSKIVTANLISFKEQRETLFSMPVNRGSLSMNNEPLLIEMLSNAY
jgi:hypothetical protein